MQKAWVDAIISFLINLKCQMYMPEDCDLLQLVNGQLPETY